MLTDRRQFIGGLLAAGVIPNATWADAGAPAYLSAAARLDGTYLLCGLSAKLDVIFQIPIPDRGHAAAAHPLRPQAVAFARRPGTFAIIINCLTGGATARLDSPSGRHFYGHGVFSQDGNWLFTTENDFEAGRGVIGVWDVVAGYRRTGEFDSGGTGPHDIKRLPGSDILVIANGGINTHPDTGRTKLNIPTMQPNLTYIDAGMVVETVSLPRGMQKNSIRHLTVSPDGKVAFGMQWQGEESIDTLVGSHQRGHPVVYFHAETDQMRDMDRYVGSITFSADARTIAATSPRGSVLHLYDVDTARLRETLTLRDVCGVAPHSDGFTVTSGTGQVCTISGNRPGIRLYHGILWDNHLIAI